MVFVLSEELRTQIHAELAMADVASGDITLVADLALHCVNEAGVTIIRVTSAMPPHLQDVTQKLASGLLHHVTGLFEHTPDTDDGLTKEAYTTIYGWGGQG